MRNLTREMILAETPGQRLNQWIAENVLTVPPLYCYQDLGAEVGSLDYGPRGHEDRIAVRDVAMAQNLPNYSTEISDAWKIVEELNSRGRSFFLEIDVEGRVRAGTGARAVGEVVFEDPDYSPTVPEAICKAALLESLKSKE